MRSSPRPWGCFYQRRHRARRRGVFPTPVGVFPSYAPARGPSRGLPHARGGVSGDPPRPYLAPASSPRPWGCFPVVLRLRPDVCVFPTPVGVFPPGGATRRALAGLPHARGGVSETGVQYQHQTESSPRPWGCFQRSTHGLRQRSVFPTPVGVFLRLPAWHRRRSPSSPRPWGCFPGDLPQRPDEGVFPTPVGVFPLRWTNPPP